MPQALEQMYAPALREFTGVFEPDSLLRSAEAATGLSTWSGDIRAWIEALCHSLETQAALTKEGRSRAHSRIFTMLVSHLRQVEHRARKGLGAPIIAPFIGTGLPRAGTTFLHNLLAQDPANRSATAAEAAIPVLDGAGTAQERTALYAQLLEFQALSREDVFVIHPYAADAPEECIFLQETSGAASLYNAYFNAPSYMQRVGPRGRDAYAWQIGVMQTLQEERGGERWALKTPAHIVNWDLMVSTFPDAKVFVNHRDPGKVIPSVASLYAKLRSLFSDTPVDQNAFTRQLVTTWAGVLERVSQWRMQHPEFTVIDVQYKELIADPIGEAERLYALCGVEFSNRAKAAMEAFLKVDHHGKGPARVYSLADYGLDETFIDDAFGPYMDRYKVAREKRT
jgi:hypothetical protein